MKHEYIKEINTEHFTADNEQEFTEYFRIKNVWGCTKIYSKKLLGKRYIISKFFTFLHRENL